MSSAPRQADIAPWLTSRWSELARLRASAVLRALGVPADGRHHAGTTWAVVDTARERGGVLGLVEQHAALYPTGIQCLFDGEAFCTLSRRGPWLVNLENLHSPLFAYWFDSGWGRAWGVFCASTPQELPAVKRHLKKFLTAETEGETPRVRPSRVLYRFYDPRVLRSTLPFFSYPTVQTMYGKLVHAWLCEGARLAHYGEAQDQVIGELYRYVLPDESFFQRLSGDARLRSEAITLPGHVLLAKQPPTPTGAIRDEDVPS